MSLRNELAAREENVGEDTRESAEMMHKLMLILRKSANKFSRDIVKLSKEKKSEDR